MEGVSMEGLARNEPGCAECIGREVDIKNPHPPGGDSHDAWDDGARLGFAAGRAAFDAVVAERDEAVKKLGIAIDVTHEFEDEKIALADRLAKWERGEWPSTEAQHGVLLDQIKELAAERDAAIAAGQKLADAVARVCGEGHPALGMWRVALAAADREAPDGGR